MVRTKLSYHMVQIFFFFGVVSNSYCRIEGWIEAFDRVQTRPYSQYDGTIAVPILALNKSHWTLALVGKSKTIKFLDGMGGKVTEESHLLLFKHVRQISSKRIILRDLCYHWSIHGPYPSTDTSVAWRGLRNHRA